MEKSINKSKQLLFLLLVLNSNIVFSQHKNKISAQLSIYNSKNLKINQWNKVLKHKIKSEKIVIFSTHIDGDFRVTDTIKIYYSYFPMANYVKSESESVHINRYFVHSYSSKEVRGYTNYYYRDNRIEYTLSVRDRTINNYYNYNKFNNLSKWIRRFENVFSEKDSAYQIIKYKNNTNQFLSIKTKHNQINDSLNINYIDSNHVSILNSKGDEEKFKLLYLDSLVIFDNNKIEEKIIYNVNDLKETDDIIKKHIGLKSTANMLFFDKIGLLLRKTYIFNGNLYDEEIHYYHK